jgi:hypothetical protein
MGITAQFRPAQHTYQSTYDPYPFKELAPLAMKFQQENMAGMNKMLATNQLIAGSVIANADQARGAEKIEELTERVSGVRDKNKSFRSPEFNMNLNKVLSDFKGDKWFQKSAHNAAMEREYATALQAPGNPADKFALQQEFEKYQELGSEGYGLLSKPTLPERKDAVPWLDKVGARYKEHGEKFVSYDEQGNPQTTEAWRGTLMDEIARGYGYDFNPKTGKLTQTGYAGGFLNSDEGRTMQRDAAWAAEVNGTDINEEFNALYQDVTVPMIEAYHRSVGSDVPVTTKRTTEDGKGMYTITGGTIHDPNVPTSMNDSKRLDKNAQIEIEALDAKLANLTEGDPSIKYWQQERNDLVNDMEERASRITATKNDMGYDKQKDQLVLDAFEGTIYGNDLELANEMLDKIAYVQSVKADERFEGFDFLSEEDGPAGASFDLERYNEGEAIIEDLKTMDYWSDVKKITRKTNNLNNKLDDKLDIKAAGITSEQLPMSGFDKRYKEQFLDAYRPASEWTVIDKDGKYLDDDEKPASNKVKVKTVYKDEVKGLGYVFTMVNTETGAEYQASSLSVQGIGEEMGKSLMKKYPVGSAKWTDGARMVYPGYSRDVNRLVANGDPRTIFKVGENREIASVRKIVDGGTRYEVTYGDGIVLENVPNKNTLLAILDILDEPATSDTEEIEELLNK